LVLLAEDGGHFDQPERGIAYRVSGKVWVNNHAHVLRPGSDVDWAYLARALENLDVRPYVSGTTRGKLTKGQAEKILLPLPPLPDQRRIAAILDEADALRAKRRAALAQLDEMARAIFVGMFGDPATNPFGWPMQPLATLCTIAGQYGAGAASINADPNLPRYIRITDINENGSLNSEHVSPGGSPDEWSDLFLRDGDLLFARSGATVGKTYLYSNSDGPCVFAGYLIRFRPAPEHLLPTFLFRFTKTEAYFEWVASRQRVVAQPNINAKQYGRDLLVPVPPMHLQREFETRLATLRMLRAHCTAARQSEDILFSSLQHRAFRGEL
jgi:type I restriction enzyme S subunit